VFAGVAGKPGTGDVRPVLTGIDTAGEAVNFVDVTPEGFRVVYYRSMPGTGKRCPDACYAVAGLVGEGLGSLESGLEFFLGGNTCKCNSERCLGALLIHQIPFFLRETDSFSGMCLTRLGVSPTL